MSNNLVKRINLVAINDNGTIKIIDTDSWYEYPFDFQYKLYLSLNENLDLILSLLYDVSPTRYELSRELFRYLQDRAALFGEVSLKYLPLVNAINNSLLSSHTKTLLIEKIDLELNQIYPYKK